MRNTPFLGIVVLTCSVVAARSATADLSGNPYRQVIVDRNVFGLKPPPPPVDPETLKPPPPKITLVGIVNVFGTRKAVLKSAEAKPAAPGQPPQPDDPYVLTEGQSQQGIQVLAIDEKAGTVKVDNNGQVDTLSFDKNGMKVPTGGAAPAPGAIPGAPGAIPRPGLPGGLPMRPGMPTMPGMPSGMGSPGVGTAGLPGMGGIAPAGGVAATDNGLPARPVRTEDLQTATMQNAVLYEANRLRNEELAKAGLVPRMPPHPLLRGLNADGNPASPPLQ